MSKGKYVVKSPVKREGKIHEPGAMLELEDAEAASLIEAGAVSAVVKSVADPADAGGKKGKEK